MKPGVEVLKQYLKRAAKELDSFDEHTTGDEVNAFMSGVARHQAERGLELPPERRRACLTDCLRRIRGVRLPRAEFLTVKEAATALGISPRSLYERIKRGDVPSVKMGRTIRVRLADLGWPHLTHLAP